MTGQDGPKQSRLFRATRPLFEGFKMFVAPPFELITSIEVEVSFYLQCTRRA